MPTLLEKLGVKPGSVTWIINAPPVLTDALHQLDDIRWSDGHDDADYIHLFVTQSDTLYEMLPACMEVLPDSGMLWVSWPKKSARVPGDLNRELVREILLTTDLVDVKVCSVDEVWSALKFVRRVKNRKN
ncbi:DUF3052 domain-containing protein [Fulvivirga sedimenti]|uniref:DUF3052 domain-containing protein n=1 Tax=Fulvivirga sedimenti TaxID=2879465 RepID=A0A9X1KX58_9BACT|nr:DUF3052 domain-containing protein [Fulvivirga sedimenti]MCA6073907.1 DUF3052 domain-containing protein [Fulvivirga sedimenti]